MRYLISVFLLLGCTQFVSSTDSDYYQEFSDSKSDELKIIFSGNINGETHPCGCRKFPRGGLPQVYAYLENLKKEKPYFYVDAGDTFFPLPQVSSYIKQSSQFTAKKIAEALDKFSLKYLTPGDNDFAYGENFLMELAKGKSFQFLITNASPQMKLDHIKWGKVKFKKTSLYFVGVTDPNLMTPSSQKLFIDPEKAIASTLKQIKKDAGTTAYQVFLISHSGLEKDETYAKRFPELNWIIGAHSQSFLQKQLKVKNTSLVQVLNRNHFLGEITLQTNPVTYDYQVVEMKEELQDTLPNNPLIPWLSKYKTTLEEIQKKEQGAIVVSADHKYMPTYISCSECHTKQVDFWQGTAHALAFQTLIKNKAAYNTNCIGCHSVGFKEAKGFLVPDKIVVSEDKDFSIEKYWSEFSSHMIPKSVREQSTQVRKKYAKKWLEFDQEKNVEHNFSNVQCLNCHNQTAEHPFDVGNKPEPMDFTQSCTECHTTDQSPTWYHKDSDGMATTLNKKTFKAKLKAVSCPKIERQ
ncbi:MAG: hypothetical protein CME62_17520 [Halobacteriovoraceae bacterium]|nr:hypothetical protein [Halobacteriovoraceae bacterium]|tara:strand:- start:36373 stop:37938 length:1566 start_codon:yes stop_codon:yes gene_type:complete